MIQLEVHKDSKLLKKSLKELSIEGLFSNALVCIAKKDGIIFIPDGNHILEEGEFIHIAASSEDLYRIYKSEVKKDDVIKKVMIIGGSRIAYYLTGLLLKRNFEVTLIELNRNRAYKIQEAFAQAVVINTDGADPEILEEERITNFDAVISLTGVDQENILISLVAKRFGIKKIMTKVDNSSLLKLTGILNMDDTITSKRAATDFVNRLVRSKENANGFSIKNLYRLEDERVEAIEFNVIENSRIVGKKLKDLNTKKNTLVTYIKDAATGNISIANGDSIIKLKDRVLVLTTEKNFAEIDDILE